MGECKPWEHLPRGIRRLVLSELPWVMSHKKVSSKSCETYNFRCELLDPYSTNIRESSHSVEKFNNLYGEYIKVYASNNGWLLMGGERSSLFLHNPFNNAIILLPDLDTHFERRAATFHGYPTSSDCEISMLWLVNDVYLHISTYRPSKDKEWNTSFLEMTGEQLHSVHYMKGELYCLFEDGGLKSYNSADECWLPLTSSFPKSHPSSHLMDTCWVAEYHEDLIMVRKDRGEDEMVKWMIFQFDWSKKCWVVKKSLKSCAIFISGSVLWTSPLKDGNGDNLEDCRLFYFDEYGGDSEGYGFKCYSYQDGEGKLIQSKEYSWIKRPALCEISFIQPPYV